MKTRRIVYMPNVIPVNELLVNGRKWFFAMHPYLGPLWLKADKETPRECQNPNRAVWRELEKWQKETGN